MTALTAGELDDIEGAALRADHEGRRWVMDLPTKGYPQRVLRQGDVVLVAECYEGPQFPPVFADHIIRSDPATVLRLVADLAAARAGASIDERCRIKVELRPVLADLGLDPAQVERVIAATEPEIGRSAATVVAELDEAFLEECGCGHRRDEHDDGCEVDGCPCVEFDGGTDL